MVVEHLDQIEAELNRMEVYYYLGPKRMNIEEAQAKAAGSQMGEPLHVVSKEGFTYVY
jgi:hypothetical protein